ncbi:MAG: glycosyltransferase family 4 protein [Desulfobacterota bacterium]|nr:glycosyltransferase family 4 protein [Thermodesulfobacteriota bacterium]
MKIVLCNKYFFLNGGTEKYLQVLLRHLPRHGHEAIPFSVRYAGSWPSSYSTYFLDPPGDPTHTHLSTIRITPANSLRFLTRSIYSCEAREALARLLAAIGGADIAYVLNIYNYMSPSIIDTFYRHDIPIVMQVGDYNLVCPAYTLLRNNRPCTLCIFGAFHHGIIHRCVKHHLAASMVRVVAMYIHRWIKIYDRVAAFVVPCRFMKNILIQGGFAPNRIHLLQYPVPPEDLPVRQPKENYMLYFGRLSPEKGIDTLIKAYQAATPPVNLVIAGRSYDNEEERLRRLVLPQFQDRIRFIGFTEGSTLSKLIGGALFSVVPSRWYDNAPISIYESFAHYTPVVASAIGGIPEQIEDTVTGKLFPPDNVQALAASILWMLEDRARLEAMGAAGRAFVQEHLGVDRHINALIELFSEARSATRKG